MNPRIFTEHNSIPVTFIASILIWIMFAALFYLWIFRKKIRREHFFHAILASLVAWMISEMIKNIFPSSRPFVVGAAPPPMTLTIPQDGAFPSGHTSASFGLATSTWRYDKKSGILFLISSVFVGLGRVFSNVHYYRDVFAGAVLGVASSYLIGELRLHKLPNRKK